MAGAAAGCLLLMAAEVGGLALPFAESGRPAVCGVAGEGRASEGAALGSGAWDRIRRQPLEALCLGLARAQIRLEREPALAMAEAEQLSRVWPGQREPLVMQARALVRLGRPDESWAMWQAAGAPSNGSPHPAGNGNLTPHALRDYAIAAALTGHADAALGAYRRLVSRVDAWPDPRHAQRLYLEAAGAALRRTPADLDEAAGYVSAARGAGSTGLRAYVVGMQALVDARRAAASAGGARVDAPEAWHFVAALRAPARPSYWPVVPPHEPYAVASLLVEDYSLTEAADLWRSYVEGLGKAPDPQTLQLARQRQARLAAPRGGTP